MKKRPNYDLLHLLTWVVAVLATVTIVVDYLFNARADMIYYFHVAIVCLTSIQLCYNFAFVYLRRLNLSQLLFWIFLGFLTTSIAMKFCDDIIGNVEVKLQHIISFCLPVFISMCAYCYSYRKRISKKFWEWLNDSTFWENYNALPKGCPIPYIYY